MFVFFIKIFSIIVPLLVVIAFFTVLERKVIGSIQRRKGPNVLGFFGTLQAIADGLKLFLKETVLPSSSNKILFIFAPFVVFFLSLLSWSVFPFNQSFVLVDLNLGILFIIAISSFGVYGVVIAGWSSNSKYAFLGSLRSAAQIISYEISIGLIFISVVLCSGQLNLTAIVFSQFDFWYFFPMLPLFILFFVSSLAETNRHPFDLPEAEAELVSGYNVEYSAIGFALFFLGEYGNIVFISSLNSLFFFGGWFFFSFYSSFFFAIKTFFFMLLFIWSRAAFPRYRYDQLIKLGWQVFLPVTLSYVLFTGGILIGFNWLPLISLVIYGS